MSLEIAPDLEAEIERRAAAEGISANALIDRLLHPEPSTESEDDEGDFGGKSVFDMFHDVIGTASFEPTDLGRHSEDYLRDGFGVPSESRLTQS